MPDGLILSLCFSALAFILAAVLGWVVIRYGPRDNPDGGRKNQAVPMPTSGGIAIFLASAPLTLAAMFLLPDAFSFAQIALLAGGLYMFLMGVWDDIIALPALPKMFAQLIIALGVAWFGIRVGHFDFGRHTLETGFLIGVLGSAAWLFVVTNAVNFMDGSDGLAMGSGAVIAFALAIMACVTHQYDIMAFALILLGALLGHLLWNGRGKLFTGDSGALFVGFYLAGLVLLFVSRLELSVWIAPLFFIAFLADVLLTLIWRYQHGRNLLQPHTEHIYQIMLKAGISHPLTAWVFAWVTMHGVLVGGMSLLFPPGGAMAGFFILLAILYVIHRRIRRSALKYGYLTV
ncbi:MAG: hypothetical protein CMK09_06720 [Ponticaulis sp.]|nr:hypothetical protein [Ponticaulis sp.]|tara:strand:- start:7681 stop:8718 length:1038 start_codon:yes stop_codon:yes gene_type:complete